MTPSDKLREFADKWGFSQDKTDEGFLIDNDRTRQCLSDLTALISEGYVSKKEHEKLAEDYQRLLEQYDRLIDYDDDCETDED